MPANSTDLLCYRIDERAINLRKSLTSDVQIGNAAAPVFLSSHEIRYVSAGGVGLLRPIRKAAVSAALTIDSTELAVGVEP